MLRCAANGKGSAVHDMVHVARLPARIPGIRGHFQYGPAPPRVQSLLDRPSARGDERVRDNIQSARATSCRGLGLHAVYASGGLLFFHRDDMRLPLLGTPREPGLLVYGRRGSCHSVRFSGHRTQHRIASRQPGPVPISRKHCGPLCMSIQRRPALQSA